jgi:VanZ family protein
MSTSNRIMPVMPAQSSRLFKRAAIFLYLIAGCLMVWLSRSFAVPESQAYYRRGVVLIDLILGAALLSQARYLSTRGASGRGVGLLSFAGGLIILIGIVSAWIWIAAH